jgi:hypothetical protein
MDRSAPDARASLPWHAADAVRRAREELTQARQQLQSIGSADGDPSSAALSEEQQAAQERVMWSDVVYHAAVNAAMRAEFLPDAG